MLVAVLATVLAVPLPLSLTAFTGLVIVLSVILGGWSLLLPFFPPRALSEASGCGECLCVGQSHGLSLVPSSVGWVWLSHVKPVACRLYGTMLSRHEVFPFIALSFAWQATLFFLKKSLCDYPYSSSSISIYSSDLISFSSVRVSGFLKMTNLSQAHFCLYYIEF